MGRQHTEAMAAGHAISDNGAELTPKFANIAIASSGDNTIVSAVASKKIRVVSLFLIAAGTVTAYFADGADNDLAGDASNGMSLIANMGFVLPKNEFGWLETVAGQSLDLNLSGAVTVAGSLTYVEV